MVRVRRLPPLLLTVALLATCEQGPLSIGEHGRSIIGGTPAPDSMLASVGALVIEQYTDKHSFCTATVIADRLLLTAAHCIQTWQGLRAQAPYLKLGFFNGAAVTSASPLLYVEGAEMHPNYTGTPTAGDQLGEYSDIAVALLVDPTPIPPMKLIRPAEVNAIVEGAPVLIAGYGLTNPDDQTSGGSKHYGSTAIGAIAPAEISILGDSRPQKCVGDSGGPTLVEVDGTAGKEQRLVGVASRSGLNCVGGSVETRVDFFLSWLRSLATLPCGSGLSPDCGSLVAGTPCSADDECQTSVCLAGADGNRSCATACDQSSGCSAGMGCVSAPSGTHYCAPAVEPAPPEPAGGCSYGPRAAPFPSTPAVLMLLAVLASPIRRRRGPRR